MMICHIGRVRLSVIAIGMVVAVAACGDGQQSDAVTKMKTLWGDQGVTPSTVAEPDPKQVRLIKLNELHKNAEAGDVMAMVELGRSYEEGRNWRSGGKFGGIPTEENDKKSEGRDLFADAGIDPLVDLDKAADWYEKAAIQGNSEAQFRIGSLLVPSRNLLGDPPVYALRRPPDPAKALEWLDKAAKQNNADALFRLGQLYEVGNGTQENKWAAFLSFKRAAELGNANAQYVVGQKHLMGAPEDPQGKCTHRYLSTDPNYGKGNIFDQFDLPFCLADKDVAAAVEWWEKAAAQDHWEAQYNLAGLYLSGEGVTKDASRAYVLYEAVAKLADKKQGFIPIAAADAQAILGAMCREGEGTPKDDAKAAEWNQKAASAGQVTAQQNIGAAYLNGNGVARDNVLGYAWSNLASGHGYSDAGKNRDVAARRMTPVEIAEAQRLSSSWKVGQVLAREGGSSGGGKQPSSQTGLAKKSTGTAFIVNALGHAITNHHVVEGCTEVRAEGHEGVIKVVTADVVNDLAQLHIPGKVTAQATISSDPAKLRQGEDIVVFGFPLNALLSSGGNLTPGVVSALTGLGNNTNQIQITAPIQPGSSGSPVFNKKGQVVGVVSMKIDDRKMARATGQIGQNINFAVSGQTLKTFLDTHNVTYRSGGFFSWEKSTADLADEARKWTLVIECWK